MNIILISLTLSAIANILLLIYYFSNSSSSSNEEPIVDKEYTPTRPNHIIKDASDWVILGYYTPNIYDWVRGRKHLTEADKASCYQLRQKLETSCEWLSKDGKVYTGMPTSNYDGIRIMNKNTDETLIISWSNDDIIVGTWIEKGKACNYIQVIGN